MYNSLQVSIQAQMNNCPYSQHHDRPNLPPGPFFMKVNNFFAILILVSFWYYCDHSKHVIRSCKHNLTSLTGCLVHKIYTFSNFTNFTFLKIADFMFIELECQTSDYCLCACMYYVYCIMYYVYVCMYNVFVCHWTLQITKMPKKRTLPT